MPRRGMRPTESTTMRHASGNVTKGGWNTVGQEDSEAELWWHATSDMNAWNQTTAQEMPLTLEEIKKRESWLHVDSVRDMVPFWRRGVEAADRGEVLSMEEFLENISRDPWGATSDEWGYAYSTGGWKSVHAESRGSWHIGSNSPWGKGGSSSLHAHGTASFRRERGEAKRHSSNERKGAESLNDKTRRSEDDAYAFVETIARRQAADAERKQRMHIFFEMSTNEKIKKINEVIRYLRKSHAV